MPEKPTATIHRQLLEILSQLPKSSQEEVLDFAISLQKKKLTQHWDAISDAEAAALKTKFADEDLAFAESVLTDYLPQLQQEDAVLMRGDVYLADLNPSRGSEQAGIRPVIIEQLR